MKREGETTRLSKKAVPIFASYRDRPSLLLRPLSSHNHFAIQDLASAGGEGRSADRQA